MAATANGGHWSYAVPLEETDGNARPHTQRREVDSDAKSIPKRNSAWDLQSDSEAAKHRRTSLRANNNAAGRKRSRNALREKRQQDEKADQGRVNDSAWIHRDKLAQIEIQEMAEAGIYVRPSRRSVSAGPGRENGRTSRSASRAGGSRPGSRTSHDRQNEILNDEDYTNAYPGYDESPRKRVSTVPSAPEEEAPQEQEQEFVPPRDFELRQPQEVAEEQYTHRQHMVRPSTSRIPVSRVSPVPVPQTVTDRDSPLPRSRAGSQNWSGSFDEMQYARQIRSPSISSQVLLDAEQDGSKITPPGSSNKTSSNDENSPPKSRVPRKGAPTGRKTSTSSAVRPGSSHQNGKRAPSATATKRPGSSSGHKSRPSTGRHSPPEGEAPWIATMYKPDPRLPPDQQMLPTHAKRMAQEQWEKEGKTGTVYDRDFKLLNDEDMSKPKGPVLSLESHNLQPLAQRSPSPKKDRTSPNGSATGHGPWPLSPSKSDTKSDNGSVRPGTSGGYKITPTIANTPTIQRSPAPSPVPPAPAPVIAHNATPRIPDIDEKEEAKPKKGCCCVVM
ncbi:hypothetical protein M409DRAFT_69253 [Zasmidium cellare ATCC 36951]|uniref:Uncharacterized protein n=1 Tax=Zasmidium cellare ATCC 36951 TaxID=1080233 RepID=A0A6A6C5C3_ZASCE|nr:uncharacterized protein M409DRAFT_69253 [Zasmidium cellare ATCC 36951]KAF2162377.1 hypothetical protein M409DRAFT_69253 [Zasmidium cellare ATCC 36951]